MSRAPGEDAADRREWLLVGGAFFTLALFLTWPVARHPGSRLPGDLGDPLLTSWTLAWDADRLRHLLRGVWDAPNFFPYRHTLLYSDHLLGIALFTAPLQWVTGNPLLAYNAAFAVAPLLAGLGAYVLAREVCRDRAGAFVAGLVFACQPFRVAHLAHLQWLTTGWLPLGLWALHSYFRTRALRRLLQATGFFVFQALSTSYFIYLGTVSAIVVFAGEWWRSRIPLRQLVLHASLAAAIGAAVLAPVARAYYDVRREASFHRTRADIVDNSADIADYLRTPPALHVWQPLSRLPTAATFPGEHELFPGAATLILAAIGIAVGRRSPHVRLYAALGAAAFVLSLGPVPALLGRPLGMAGPYALLVRVVPGWTASAPSHGSPSSPKSLSPCWHRWERAGCSPGCRIARGQVCSPASLS